jgi:hypothetical protein
MQELQELGILALGMLCCKSTGQTPRTDITAPEAAWPSIQGPVHVMGPKLRPKQGHLLSARQLPDDMAKIK